jgi:hypothetical protein
LPAVVAGQSPGMSYTFFQVLASLKPAEPGVS